MAWGTNIEDKVKSPCVGVCQLDVSQSFCTGCFRTRAHIGVWSTASDKEKTKIILDAQKLADHTLAEVKARKLAAPHTNNES